MAGQDDRRRPYRSSPQGIAGGLVGFNGVDVRTWRPQVIDPASVTVTGAAPAPALDLILRPGNTFTKNDQPGLINLTTGGAGGNGGNDGTGANVEQPFARSAAWPGPRSHLRRAALFSGVPPIGEARFRVDEIVLQIVDTVTLAQVQARLFGITLISSEHLPNGRVLYRLGCANGVDSRRLIAKAAHTCTAPAWPAQSRRAPACSASRRRAHPRHQDVRRVGLERRGNELSDPDGPPSRRTWSNVSRPSRLAGCAVVHTAQAMNERGKDDLDGAGLVDPVAALFAAAVAEIDRSAAPHPQRRERH